jgi:hypothetical protein
MTQIASEIESALAAAYEAQAADYQQALQLADGLLSNWDQADQPRTLEQVAALVERTAGTGARAAELRRQWQTHGQAPGPRLTAALQAAARYLENLAARIDSLQSLATATRDRLLPEITGLVRGRQMQQAYQAQSGSRPRGRL